MNTRFNVRTVENISPSGQQVEIVERKGRGHPDTICDNISEVVSIALCNFYIERFGSIMHHNVDKALLVGGKANPRYGGGSVTEPMQIILAGRALMQKGGIALDVKDLAVEAVRNYISNKFRFIDVERHVDIKVKTGPGSADLIDLFDRFGGGEVPFANDTSYGVGYYPLDELETAVYQTEKFLNSDFVKERYPYIGEDIKIMGVRYDSEVDLTVAVAMVDRFISDKDDYFTKKEKIKTLLRSQEWIRNNYLLAVNTADSYQKESVYITVTGTSSEQGDDGQVGRGNRANGLITPFRPMTIEAVAGKNPVNHVGKLYNILAIDISRQLVESNFASEACVHLVSRIGAPVNKPQLVDVELKDQNVKTSVISDFVEYRLNGLGNLWKSIIKGEYEIT